MSLKSLLVARLVPYEKFWNTKAIKFTSTKPQKHLTQQGHQLSIKCMVIEPQLSKLLHVWWLAYLPYKGRGKNNFLSNLHQGRKSIQFSIILLTLIKSIPLHNSETKLKSSLLRKWMRFPIGITFIYSLAVTVAVGRRARWTLPSRRRWRRSRRFECRAQRLLSFSRCNGSSILLPPSPPLTAPSSSSSSSSSSREGFALAESAIPLSA